MDLLGALFNWRACSLASKYKHDNKKEMICSVISIIIVVDVFTVLLWMM